LVEVMVAVVIIAILSSVSTVKISTVLNKVRNARRKVTLVLLKSALEMYRNDHGHFPIAGSQTNFLSSEPGDVSYQGPDWIPGLAPDYVAALPRDPLGGPTSIVSPDCTNHLRAYTYASDGVSFKLESFCAAEGPVSPDDIFNDPADVPPSTCWQVCSGTPACLW